MRGFVQKMIVGGGCMGISSSSGPGFRDVFPLPPCLDFVLLFPDLTGSGGARRSDTMLSGGLQSK